MASSRGRIVSVIYILVLSTPAHLPPCQTNRRPFSGPVRLNATLYMLPFLSLMYSSSSSPCGALTIKRGESFPVVVDNDQDLALFRPTVGANPITDVSFRSNSSKSFAGIRMVRYATPVTPLGCSTCSVGTWRPLYYQYAGLETPVTADGVTHPPLSRRDITAKERQRSVLRSTFDIGHRIWSGYQPLEEFSCRCLPSTRDFGEVSHTTPLVLSARVDNFGNRRRGSQKCVVYQPRKLRSPGIGLPTGPFFRALRIVFDWMRERDQFQIHPILCDLAGFVWLVRAHSHTGRLARRTTSKFSVSPPVCTPPGVTLQRFSIRTSHRL